MYQADFIVIGSGMAGLTFAIKASRFGRVAIITKGSVEESSSIYAQGGIASVLSDEDTFEEHIKDTISVGVGLCNEEVVDTVVRQGPGMIEELIELGANFTGTTLGGQKGLDLGREGGHSKRRIVHAGDITGREVGATLLEAVKQNPKIDIFEDHIAVDLITHTKFIGPLDKERVWGVYALNKRSGEIETFITGATVLATGGAGKVYIYTSNPDVATGDGVAMAYRAGAEIKNMEFIQFHPTCLYHQDAKSFLISEALRGEGALLKRKDGSRFMDSYHEEAELAPRDIVARAIDFELKKTGDDCMYLDISEKDADFVRERFPNIYKRCMELGIDITKEPIPVVPAAHYICGGIATDVDGRTSIKGLYSIGESACTGLHGANRLASNSLLECLVMADRAAACMEDEKKNQERLEKNLSSIPPWDELGTVRSNEAVVVTQNWEEIRRLMWNYVGIVRSEKRLRSAQDRLSLLLKEINQYYWDFKVTSDLVELRNIATVADLIVRSALLRKESRGLHYNIDFLESDDKNFKKDTTLKKNGA
ncbi:MAG: L-aspartate oxidase [Deltaproteobacteria bacterium]|nr:L-aspartate oxidase [Deltaproteobacteria bacterium]